MKCDNTHSVLGHLVGWVVFKQHHKYIAEMLSFWFQIKAED